MAPIEDLMTALAMANRCMEDTQPLGPLHLLLIRLTVHLHTLLTLLLEPTLFHPTLHLLMATLPLLTLAHMVTHPPDTA